MSSTYAIQPSSSTPRTGLWKEAVARVQKFLQRLVQRFVIPVSSTDEMNEVWKLYRLIPNTDSAAKISDC